ncbi:hypothetical protein [Candidatus Vampirococcus lugosii]|uniref:Uncharacterized protein n=1 Tax=Candidatus Vampirococcus lugosii TaxID=2789015 RepID=A0ABS5QPR9_9BACT|nr:hypothetical protein [Candidatus Vampirococcus lugosii]MBS8122543.1 hypothetical protein [Candidatus Vampirococcus lugosii]
MSKLKEFEQELKQETKKKQIKKSLIDNIKSTFDGSINEMKKTAFFVLSTSSGGKNQISIEIDKLETSVIKKKKTYIIVIIFKLLK